MTALAKTKNEDHDIVAPWRLLSVETNAPKLMMVLSRSKFSPESMPASATAPGFARAPRRLGE